jgi:hypothetical protein
LARIASEHFDNSFNVEEPIRIVDTLSDLARKGTRRVVPDGIRRQARVRYQLLWSVARLRHRKQAIGANPSILVREWRRNVADESHSEFFVPVGQSQYPIAQDSAITLFEYRGCEIGTLPLAGRRVKPSLLGDLFAHSFQRSYRLDHGVPHTEGQLRPNILLVERWPESGLDPMKPVRAAAFAGWACTAAQSSEDLSLLFGRLEELFAQRVK